MILIVSALTLF